MVKGVESVLARPEKSIDLRVEYMDAGRVTTPSYLVKLADYFRAKYGQTKFGAVIASDREALDFVLRFRDGLFPGVPVVFCGVADTPDHPVPAKPYLTGVLEEGDVAATLQTALALVPQAGEVVAAVNDSPVGRVRKERLLEALKGQGRPLRHTIVENPVLKDFETILGSKGPETIVLLLGSFSDEEGSAVSVERAMEGLVRHKAPLFALRDEYLGRGIVGGVLISGFHQGETAARMVLRVLAGEPPEGIPVERKGLNRPMFDFQQMARFAMAIDALPQGSTVINTPVTPPPPPRQLFPWLPLGAAGVLFIVVLILAGKVVADGKAKKGLKSEALELEKRLADRTKELMQANTDLGEKIAEYTDLRKVQKETERKYRALFDEAPNPVFIVDGEGRFLEANQAALDFLESSREGLRAASMGDFNPQRDTKVEGEGLGPTWTPGTSETQFLVNGKVKTLLLSLVPLAPSGSGHLYGIGQDISDRKRTEAALKESQENLRKAINLSPVAITIAHLNGFVEYANDKFVRTFGYTREDIPTMERWWELAHPDWKHRQEVISAWRSALGDSEGSGKDMEPQEWTVTCSDGSTKDIEFQWVTIGDRLVTIYNDMSGRKRVEEEILKSKNLESLGTLAGGIAHDFNNLLMIIMGNISLAKMAVDGTGKAYQRLLDAERASLMAKDLTQQLITFSRGGDPFKKVLMITPLLMDVCHIALSGSNVKCQYVIPEDLRPVQVDESQLKQAVHNLVTNAREAMPQGGTITISAENVTVTGDGKLPLPPGEYVKLTIQDKGVGIKPEHLPKIFDPYFTTKEMSNQKGTGLGLTITHSIIKKHGGHITVDSAVGAGSFLHVYLPAHEGPAPAAAGKEEPEEEPVKSKGTILVMDDSKGVRDVTGAMLGHLGYDAVFAQDGLEAIDLYRDSIRSGQPFMAVILDLTVQGGMGAKEALPVLVAIDPQVNAIISSGYTRDPLMIEYRKYGFRNAITKPYKMEELVAVLGEVEMLGPGRKQSYSADQEPALTP